MASPYPIEPQVPRWLGISALGDQTFVPQTAIIIWSYHSNMVRLQGGDSDWNNNCVSECPRRQNKIWIPLEVWNSVSRSIALIFSQNIHFQIMTWGNFLQIGELTNLYSCTTWNEGKTSILKYKCCRPHFKAQIWHVVGSVLIFMCICKVIKLDNATYLH